jgi:hypothetical protein
MGRLSMDVVAQWGCGGSVGIWWLRGDVVAQRGCGGPVGMWWLCGDVVAQSALTVPGSISHSLLRGGRNHGCVLCTGSV